MYDTLVSYKGHERQGREWGKEKEKEVSEVAKRRGDFKDKRKD